MAEGITVNRQNVEPINRYITVKVSIAKTINKSTNTAKLDLKARRSSLVSIFRKPFHRRILTKHPLFCPPLLFKKSWLTKV